jgi:hypothetical protein
MGPFVTLFDLLFALAFLASAGFLLTAGTLAIAGRGSRALSLLRMWAIGAAVYMTALISVSFAQPRRVLSPGEPRCFDDWCITVENATRSGARYDVALRIYSRARRVNQRALDAAVFLTDDRGRRFDPLPDASAVPLSALLHPGESIATARAFIVPPDASQVGLVVNHGSGPANFVIGDENSLFHKRTIVRFP